MKTNYFTKVENKYVFNLSLIFWHFFIALSSLAIAISIAVFLWSLIPSSPKKVLKQAYPAIKQYPAPVKVTLNELNLAVDKRKEVTIKAPKPIITKTIITKQQIVKDTTGEKMYNNTLDTLRVLIPPSKYSWKGTGSWSYPYGIRYWKYYKQKKYRVWEVKTVGLEKKLNYTFNKVGAKTYANKKRLLNGYISIVKLLPEEKRLEALKYLINNISKDINRNLNIYKSLANVVIKLKWSNKISYINQLAKFGKRNPNDGIGFINYIVKIINKFDTSQQLNIISNLINSYYNYFSQNLAEEKVATNLFLPLIAKVQAKQQTKAINQYYRLYLNKNYKRNRAIARIEREHQQAINKINNTYQSELQRAKMVSYTKNKTKDGFRSKSLTGIAGGIVLIVLIAFILVFLSIQRSVKSIEEKMVNSRE